MGVVEAYVRNAVVGVLKMWTPSPMETERVTKLDGISRYRYSIKKIADNEGVWGLWLDGWALATDVTGRTLVPLWPHSSFAAPCATGQWAGYQAKDIPLRDFLARWIPGLKRDQRLVAMFPTLHGEGVAIQPDQLRDDLAAELAHYE